MILSFFEIRNPPWWNRRTRLERFLCALTAVTMATCVAMCITLAMVQLRPLDPFSTRGSSDLSSSSAQLLVDGRSSVIGPAATRNRLFKSGKSMKDYDDFSQHQDSHDKLNENGYEDIVHAGDGKFKLYQHKNGEDQQKQQWPTISPSQESQKQPSDICLTRGCVQAAAELISNLDEEISPCDDFYQFACGGWIKRQVIPDERTSVSVFSLLQDQLTHKLRVLIESEEEKDEPEFFESMRMFYKSCMDLKSIEKSGDTPLHMVLKRFGGWPVVAGQNWDGSNFDWIDTLIMFRKHGFTHDILLDLSVTPDYRDNTCHIVDLDQTTLGLPDRSYYKNGLNDTTIKSYHKLMIESAVYLGADRSTAEKEMLQALKFEMKIADLSLPREERRNMSSLYNKYQIKGLKKLAPNIEWRKYFDSLLGVELCDEEEIIVDVPKYVENLDILLMKTDKRVLANYLIWRVVMQSFSMLGKRWRELIHDFNSVLTGQTREQPRWETCMASVINSLSIAMSSLYVRHHFKGNSKESALEMVGYIHREFMNMLDQIDWMDPKTKERARAKALSIRSYIGYPQELHNNSKIEEFYEGLTFTKDYFQNVQKLRLWSTDYAFGFLDKPNVKGDYLNYGAIGFVIGHEITHGFDDRGRQFDQMGNNVNWWEEETDQRFKKRAQCIIEQYGNYTVPENGLKVNGINTQGENIADNGGIKEAFRAYQSYVRDHGPEPYLPGLNYTPEQMFWISAASVWCGKYRPETLKLYVQTGSHSPARFRVTGVVQNSKEFSRVFGCSTGTAMNQDKKCAVW
ncbi:membrane metallo-endopeptidase-like protein 1-like protein [Sarcoptes scabiei]|uniref:Membrane metallo-endopeptidase-like protein 1-like protein n=1 Tax=Sarcoptes scabiei TaxID=52283 RepID=A0A131ZVS3_SARSC|nr:membrane metallo-endopeptidase-like protein 1-like protein [Sarcoptes scabiei]